MGTKLTDPLHVPAMPDRVFYAAGAMLGADDFLDEQTYHRGRLARVLAALYGSGTVAGLQVQWQAAADGKPEELHLMPGLALDRLGRMIEIPAKACIRLDKWYQAQDPGVLAEALSAADKAVVVDVFARFLPCQRGQTPAFAATTFDSISATVPARVRDGYAIDLVAAVRLNLPETPWKNLPAAGDPDFKKKLNAMLLAAGHEFGSEVEKDGLKPLAEHQSGQDTTGLFLARVKVPADDVPKARPARRNEPVLVFNQFRNFVYPPSLLALLAGLGTNGDADA
jgi:hypothetical protein